MQRPLWTLPARGPLLWDLEMPLVLINFLALLSRRSVYKNSDGTLDSSLGLGTTLAQGASEAVLGRDPVFQSSGTGQDRRGEGPQLWESGRELFSAQGTSQAGGMRLPLPHVNFPWSKGYFLSFPAE